MDIPDYIKPQIDELDQKISDAKELASDPEMTDIANEEIAELEKQRENILNAIKPADEEIADMSNSRKAILEIRGAAGGEEAKIWADDLFRMYLRYIELKGWKTEMLGSLGVKINGKGCYADLQYESGVHRVQRVPATEKNGRIHTSTATVAVLPIVPPTQITINPSDVRMDYFRSGGAGGQNVNKVNTGVRLTHAPSGVVVECTQKRTQYENREIAEELLRGRIWQIEDEKRQAEIDEQRSSAVGRGMRSEKIRTYNYPQNRVTDHRINKSWYSLSKIMDGNLEPVIEELNNPTEE